MQIDSTPVLHLLSLQDACVAENFPIQILLRAVSFFFSKRSLQVYKINCIVHFYVRVFFIIVPTPLEGGGELYTQKCFFCSDNLADRYIQRRELRLVSLESLSREEYEKKTVF